MTQEPIPTTDALAPSVDLSAAEANPAESRLPSPAPAAVEAATAEAPRVEAATTETARVEAARPAPAKQRGVRALVGVLTIVIPTIAAGFTDVLLNDKFTVITGATLAIATVVAALLFRAGDRSLAVITPPLAYFAATITAGQLTVSSNGDPLIKQGLMIFTSLSFAAPWIVGSTLAALVIVLIRRAMDR